MIVCRLPLGFESIGADGTKREFVIVFVDNIELLQHRTLAGGIY